MTVSFRRVAPALPCALVLLAAACRPAPAAPAADARAMREAVTRYESASNDGDADALSALYADDALLLPPDGAVVAGRDSILAFWKDGIEPGISFEVVDSKTEGGTGFVAGRFLVEATDSAPADSGKYVLCLRRQPDGAWRVVADIWNSTPSADELDDQENLDPRTHVTRADYRLRTMLHMATKSSAVESQPTTLQRVNTALRNSSRSSPRRSSRH